MTNEQSRQRAAQAWCQPETKKIEMDVRLASAFADILRLETQELLEHLETAWCLIANAGVPLGDWSSMPTEWREAAEKWRDEWYRILSANATITSGETAKEFKMQNKFSQAVSRTPEFSGSVLVKQMFAFRKDKRYRAGLIQGLRMAGAITQDEWEIFNEFIKSNVGVSGGGSAPYTPQPCSQSESTQGGKQ